MLGNSEVIVKDKEERRLSKVKISIMRNPRFALWSGLMTVGKTSVVEDIPTACTNGRDELYGREFIQKLDDKELAFVVLHETLHKAYRHMFTWRKLHDENHKLANLACDYVINLQLHDMDKDELLLAMPKQANGKPLGAIDERFRGMNAKQVFDILKEEQSEGGDGDEEGEGGGSGGGGGFDEHDWEGAKALDEQAKKELERDIDSAIRQGLIAEQKVAGKGGGGMGRDLSELL